MNKTLKAILAIAAVLLFFGISTLIVFFTNRVPMNPSGTIGNTPGNLNNHGLFCEYDGTVYFSNPYDNGSLYSMNPDETNMKKLNSSSVELLNAGGRFLYYFQVNAGGGTGLGYVRSRSGIYRSALDGSRTTSMNMNTAFHMQLVDNYLYYLVSDEAGPHFYKQKIDQSEEILLSDTIINPACVADGIIYYNGTENDHALYSLNPSTDTVSTVWEGNLWNPIVMGDYVYYMDVANNYRLCRYSLSADVIEVLTQDRLDMFNLNETYIYYQKSSQTAPCLMRMYLDGSNPEVVAEGIFSDINMTSQYVYFHPFDTPAPTYRTPVDGPVSVTTFETARNAALANSN